MRVTKIIREYVEKTVTNALPYGAPTEEYKAAQAEMAKLQEEVNKKVVKYAAEVCAEANKQLPEGFVIKLHSAYPITQSCFNSPLDCTARLHEKEIREKRAAAVEQILLELELGATKADLERLIKEAIA